MIGERTRITQYNYKLFLRRAASGGMLGDRHRQSCARGFFHGR